MIFVVISIVLYLLAGDYYGVFEAIITSIGVAIAAAIFGALIAFCLPHKTYDKIAKYPIVNMADGSGLSGRFLLGSGNINSKMSYAFYYIQDDGFYKMAVIESSIVRVSYTKPEEQPTCVQHILSTADVWYNWFSLDSDIGDEEYELYVPKGSINTQYKLDAQ